MVEIKWKNEFVTVFAPYFREREIRRGGVIKDSLTIEEALNEGHENGYDFVEMLFIESRDSAIKTGYELIFRKQGISLAEKDRFEYDRFEYMGVKVYSFC